MAIKKCCDSCIEKQGLIATITLHCLHILFTESSRKKDKYKRMKQQETKKELKKSKAKSGGKVTPFTGLFQILWYLEPFFEKNFLGHTLRATNIQKAVYPRSLGSSFCFVLVGAQIWVLGLVLSCHVGIVSICSQPCGLTPPRSASIIKFLLMYCVLQAPPSPWSS